MLARNHAAVVADALAGAKLSNATAPAVDFALRAVAAALLGVGPGMPTTMVGAPGEIAAAGVAARFVAERLCVPRDMGAPAAAQLRAHLTTVADVAAAAAPGAVAPPAPTAEEPRAARAPRARARTSRARARAARALPGAAARPARRAWSGSAYGRHGAGVSVARRAARAARARARAPAKALRKLSGASSSREPEPAAAHAAEAPRTWLQVCEEDGAVSHYDFGLRATDAAAAHAPVAP